MAIDTDNDDWMWNAATLAARRQLIARITRAHPAITAATVESHQAPLIVQGTLADGRIFLFRARHGRASLAVTVHDQPDEPVPITAPCSDTLAVEDTDAAATAFTTLYSKLIERR